MRKFILFNLLAMLFIPAVLFAANEDAGRITKEELKSRLEKGDDLLLLDMRSKKSYDVSNVKIKGSVRIEVGDLDAGLKDVPKEKEIITYCS